MNQSFQLEWLRADGKASLECGTFATRAQAEADAPAALAELIAAGNADDRQWLEAGRMVVTEVAGA